MSLTNAEILLGQVTEAISDRAPTFYQSGSFTFNRSYFEWGERCLSKRSTVEHPCNFTACIDVTIEGDNVKLQLTFNWKGECSPEMAIEALTLQKKIAKLAKDIKDKYRLV
jgi:hypothetical protein